MDTQEATHIAEVFRTTARSYNEQKDVYLHRVMDFFLTTADKFGWPQEKETWNVYLLSASLFGHYALMFEYDKKKESTFFIELWLDRENTDKELQVIMQFGIIEAEFEGYKQISLGSIEKSLIEIFETAYDVLQDLGPYQATLNSCQNYAKNLAIALGTPKEVKTGFGTVARTAFTLSAATAIALKIFPKLAKL